MASVTDTTTQKRASDDLVDDSTTPKKAKTADNVFVNLLPKEEIDAIVLKVFTENYSRGSQGRKSVETSKVSHPVPHLLHIDGHVWANPFAFSWTKEFMQGYPCIPWKSTALAEFAPPSTNTKSTWIPRLPIHCVLWRYYNDYREIPAGFQVSHVTDQSLLLSSSMLCLEPGEVNRARVACRMQKWHAQMIDGAMSPGRSRCPHWEKPCREPLTEPTLDVFKMKGQKPIGKILIV